MNRVLGLLRARQAVTREALGMGAGATSAGAAGDLVVGVQTENYACAVNGDAIPAELLAPICNGRRLIKKISIGGQPGILRNGVASASDAATAEKYWYRFDQLRADSKQSGLSLVDVTAAFADAWTYHLPRMTDVYKIDACSSCLAVAIVGAGRNPAGPRVDVISLDIFY